MAGKPKPTSLKLLHGNPGKRPLPKNEPKPELKIPDCPEGVSVAHKKEWKWITEQLAKVGLVTEIDKATLLVYVDTYVTLHDSIKKIKTMGRVIKQPIRATNTGKITGHRHVKNPHVEIANKAKGQIVKIAGEFGLSPAARTRIEAKAEGNDKGSGTSDLF